MDPPQPIEDVAPELPDAALHDALAHLGADDRELLRLWAWEELQPAEIAVTLGTTANAVSIRLHRARKRLGELLQADTESLRLDLDTSRYQKGAAHDR